MPEDGIIGVPLLYAYKFYLNDNSLILADKTYPLENDTILIPVNYIQIIKLDANKKEGQVIIENNLYVPD